jgi:hypothetical protein
MSGVERFDIGHHLGVFFGHILFFVEDSPRRVVTVNYDFGG